MNGDVGPPGFAARRASILCVDDEPNVLSALRRLLRQDDYTVFCAPGASEGLKVLAREPVDIVISDMRMPEVDGAAFLEQVRTRWPATLRVLLTGYADVHAIIGAINRGEIYRYITKPWNEHDVRLLIRHALDRIELERDKQRLEELTRVQNDALRALNASLEQRVTHRTFELNAAKEALLASNERLKSNFITSIKILSRLVDMRGGAAAGHARRVADLARRIALNMDLPASEVHDVFIAGLLHEIGKTGFPDQLLAMPVSMMKGELLGQYRKYPQLGEQLLIPLDDLHAAAGIVCAHRERFDGGGYPNRLAGFNIPIGARILAVACDFEGMRCGLLTQQKLDPIRAAELILEGRGTRYDPAVVTAFHEVRTGGGIAEQVAEMVLRVAQLKPGMVMSRDLLAPDGALLLSGEHILNERLLAQLADFERRSGTALRLHVRVGQVKCTT